MLETGFEEFLDLSSEQGRGPPGRGRRTLPRREATAKLLAEVGLRGSAPPDETLARLHPAISRRHSSRRVVARRGSSPEETKLMHRLTQRNAPTQ
jgi:hypothetical protein